LRHRPIAISGDGANAVVVAASKEAKARGIKTPILFGEAKAKCPQIIAVSGDFHKYVFVHRQIMDIFDRFSPDVEVFSIDEAFLDLTKTQQRFGGPGAVAEKIKKAMRQEIGEWITCSIGIAPSKTIAKLVSSLSKPDGLSIIESKDVYKLLSKTNIEDLCGIGQRMKEHLNRLGIKKASDLGKYSLLKLEDRFGKNGYFYHALGRGEDVNKICAERDQGREKSFGHNRTFKKSLDFNIRDERNELLGCLLKLAENAAKRMRRQGMIARTVTLHIRFADFSSILKSKTFSLPFYTGLEVYQKALIILSEVFLERPVRLVGVRLSNLKSGYFQKHLLLEDRKKQELTNAFDAINKKWGACSIQHGLALYSQERAYDYSTALQRRFRVS
jgi:DNA polymerase-4